MSVDVRRPPLEQGALAEDRAGPDLGPLRAVDVDDQYAVEQEVQLATLAGENVSDCSLRIFGLAAPRIIRPDNSRSNAVSTSVTNAGESSSL